MTEATTTYPTPAADKLAQALPLLEQQLAAERAARSDAVSRHHVTALKREYADRYGRNPAASLAKPALVEMIVNADIDGIPGKFQGSPAATRLAQLQQHARVEAFVLDGVQEHTVEGVNATYQKRLGEFDASKANPETLASLAAAWEYDRATATAWQFIGRTIDKGQTPIAAARQALLHFTQELIHQARSATSSGSGWVRTLVNAHEASAYAKFVDSIMLYVGGLLDPEIAG